MSQIGFTDGLTFILIFTSFWKISYLCLNVIRPRVKSYGEISTVTLSPKKLTQKITVKIRIKGMNNIRKATCTLDGIAESIFLVSRQNSEKTVTQVLRLSNPVYDSGSVTEGTLSTTISVFGFDVEIPHNLHLKAKLVDGKTIFEESFNDLAIRRLDEEDGTMSVFIDMACEKTVPNVKTEGSSGFDADVDKWDDEVNSDIDI